MSSLRDEYLLHPTWTTKRPYDPSALHLNFKKWLGQAGLAQTIKMHERRHSAADNLWRETGNLVLAQQLLRATNPSRRRRTTCIQTATV